MFPKMWFNPPDRGTHFHLRQLNSKKILKVVILGDSAVGKSCLTDVFISNRFTYYQTFSVIRFATKRTRIDDENYELQIYHMVGQNRFRTIRAPYYKTADICMMVYAVNDKSSFHNLRYWVDEFRFVKDMYQSNENFPFVVVGNKTDENSVIDSKQAEKWCSENGIVSYIETSAKLFRNVNQAFEMGVKRWVALKQEM